MSTLAALVLVSWTGARAPALADEPPAGDPSEPSPEEASAPAAPSAEASAGELPPSPAVAAIDAAGPTVEATEPSGWSDQGIGVALGAAFGGRLTPGGIRLTGAYLYRLSQADWFDGAAAFTLGAGDAACFRDRDDQRVCDHGAVDGFAVDFVGAVRRTWPVTKRFAPFARVGAGLRLLRFSGDQVAGVAVPLIAGGGVSADLSPTMRLVASGQLELGGGLFSRGVGTGPQFGLSLGAGIEFALR